MNLKCDICQKNYASYKTLWYHKKTKHNISLNEKNNGDINYKKEELNNEQNEQKKVELNNEQQIQQIQQSNKKKEIIVDENIMHQKITDRRGIQPSRLNASSSTWLSSTICCSEAGRSTSPRPTLSIFSR